VSLNTWLLFLITVELWLIMGMLENAGLHL
jgi:hypothetical protein